MARFDVTTAYAGLLTLTSISHAIALFGLSDNPLFFRDVYTPELAGKAIFIFNTGSIVVMESIRRFLKRSNRSGITAAILTRRSFYQVFLFSVLVFFLGSNYKALVLSLGSFGTFFLTILNGSIFLLSFIAHRTQKNVLFVLSYTIFLSVWYLQYSYLRMEIVIPFLAYLAGDLLANQSFWRLHIYSKSLIVFSILVFPPLFTFLGKNRSKVWGSNKLDMVIESVGTRPPEDGETILTRLSIIPQLSNIVRLTEKNGYYDGVTLSYLGYVFIPRFLWPEKPLIKQGQWFALEIGAAHKERSGKANNSVNMTVPGELYLNFGWLGMLLGCVAFGWLLAILWNHSDYMTLFGWTFRFYLVFLGFFSLGADLQIIPTLVAYLLIYRTIVFFVRFGKSRTFSARTVPLKYL